MPSLLHLSSACNASAMPLQCLCNASASQSKICFLVTRFLVLPRGIVSVSLRLVGRPWHWGQGQAQQKIVHIFSQAMQGAHNTCIVQQQHPDKALQGILQDPALSNSSKQTYARRLMAMSAKVRQPISELAMQPMTVLPRIKKQYRSLLPDNSGAVLTSER